MEGFERLWKAFGKLGKVLGGFVKLRCKHGMSLIGFLDQSCYGVWNIHNGDITCHVGHVESIIWMFVNDLFIFGDMFMLLQCCQ